MNNLLAFTEKPSKNLIIKFINNISSLRRDYKIFGMIRTNNYNDSDANVELLFNIMIALFESGMSIEQVIEKTCYFASRCYFEPNSIDVYELKDLFNGRSKDEIFTFLVVLKKYSDNNVFDFDELFSVFNDFFVDNTTKLDFLLFLSNHYHIYIDTNNPCRFVIDLLKEENPNILKYKDVFDSLHVDHNRNFIYDLVHTCSDVEKYNFINNASKMNCFYFPTGINALLSSMNDHTLLYKSLISIYDGESPYSFYSYDLPSFLLKNIPKKENELGPFIELLDFIRSKGNDISIPLMTRLINNFNDSPLSNEVFKYVLNFLKTSKFDSLNHNTFSDLYFVILLNTKTLKERVIYSYDMVEVLNNCNHDDKYKSDEKNYVFSCTFFEDLGSTFTCTDEEFIESLEIIANSNELESEVFYRDLFSNCPIDFHKNSTYRSERLDKILYKIAHKYLEVLRLTYKDMDYFHSTSYNNYDHTKGIDGVIEKFVYMFSDPKYNDMIYEEYSALLDSFNAYDDGDLNLIKNNALFALKSRLIINNEDDLNQILNIISSTYSSSYNFTVFLSNILVNNPNYLDIIFNFIVDNNYNSSINLIGLGQYISNQSSYDFFDKYMSKIYDLLSKKEYDDYKFKYSKEEFLRCYILMFNKIFNKEGNIDVFAEFINKFDDENSIFDKVDFSYFLDSLFEGFEIDKLKIDNYNILEKLANSYYSSIVSYSKGLDEYDDFYSAEYRSINKYIYLERFINSLSSFEDKYKLTKSIVTKINDFATCNNFVFNNSSSSFHYYFDLSQNIDNIIFQMKKVFEDPDIGIYFKKDDVFNDVVYSLHNFSDAKDLFFKFINTFNITPDSNKYNYADMVLNVIRITDMHDMELLDFLRKTKPNTSYLPIFKKRIINKELLLDYDLMKDYYKLSDFYHGTIAELYMNYSRNTITARSSYREEMSRAYIYGNEERDYISSGRLNELLDKYKKIGIVSDTVLNDLYVTLLPSMKNLTYEEFLKRLIENVDTHTLFSKMYYNSELLSKIKILLPKTRFKELPPAEVIEDMDLEFCKKFNLGVWRKLLNNPLFACNMETKKAMIKVINFAGLFENDSEVKTRIDTILDLFSVDRMIFSLNDISILDNTSGLFVSYLENGYEIKPGVNIPESLQPYLPRTFGEVERKRLLDLYGNVGSDINKFIYPYSKEGNVWTLKRGVDISRFVPRLKEQMTNEEMQAIINKEDPLSEIMCFLNPYSVVQYKRYKVKPGLKDYSKLSKLFTYDSRTLSLECLLRLFERNTGYLKEVFDFFVKYYDQIMLSNGTQSIFPIVIKKVEKIKKFYMERGNSNPDYIDMYNYCISNGYNPDFGNEEFAQEAKVNEVSKEGFDFYQELLKKTRARKLSTIPRHEKVYEITAKNGKKFKILTKTLRGDDPLNLIVGENRFAGCCQKYGGPGETCMVHAASSQSGGIFVTYLLEGDEKILLTQSWTWTNESKLCFDNVEASEYFKDHRRRDVLTEVVMEALLLASKDLVETSDREIDEYCSKEAAKIKKSNLSNEEKVKMLDELEEFRKRQKLSIVTVGEGCDDLRVKERFPQKDLDETTVRAKDSDFVTYSDSKLGQQHIIYQTDAKRIPSSDKFKDRPIYRDPRQVKVERGRDIKSFTLKRIADIEKIAHKENMLQYSRGESYYARTPEALASINNCDVDNLRVVIGEDWYYIYGVEDDFIEVYDMAKTSSRFEDESISQTMELSSTFNNILKESIIVDSQGKVAGVKEIKADLREDTSYLLFLAEIRRGVIEQVGDDYAYGYSNSSNRRVVSKEEQKDILSRAKEIKNAGNEDMIMHRVTFKPTIKTIEKMYGKIDIEGRNI
ncbi:MAG: hypothetical protein IKR57_03320 [Bacilli bacterium]|nr:hypothetical protein [Bacilli bacterium]